MPRRWPKGLKDNRASRGAGQACKQINASFGQFSKDTLMASTGALASNTFGDTTYTTPRPVAPARRARDALAGKIRWRSGDAEFNGQKLNDKQAKDWIDQADDLLDRAAALA